MSSETPGVDKTQINSALWCFTAHFRFSKLKMRIRVSWNEARQLHLTVAAKQSVRLHNSGNILRDSRMNSNGHGSVPIGSLNAEAVIRSVGWCASITLISVGLGLTTPDIASCACSSTCGRNSAAFKDARATQRHVGMRWIRNRHVRFSQRCRASIKRELNNNNLEVLARERVLTPESVMSGS